MVGYIQGDFGGVVADEPRAALVGRDVLSAGGTAVDAAIAMYFTLSVTYPGAATLDGGGVCVIQQSNNGGRVAAIDFGPLLIHRDGKTIAVPGGVRGMFALHARYGRLRWARLIQPAERLARFGNHVSRAFARRIATVPAGAFRQEGARGIFLVGGKAAREGDVIHQVQLATVLAAIRLRGAGDFYTGDVARRLAEGMSQLYGVHVSVADIRKYRPRWIPTAKLDVGNNVLHMPEGAKAEAAIALWKKIEAEGPRAATSAIEAAAAAGGPADSAGFAAVDTTGGAAACTVGAGGALRDPRVIGDTGILASGPRPTGEGYPGLPMILVNVPLRDVYGAATGTGAPGSGMRAVAAAARVFTKEEKPAEALMSAPKLAGARTDMIFCPGGANNDPDKCRYVVEPGAAGLAASAVK